MDADVKPFKVLLAEDDPVSRAFLCEAIAACGAEVTAFADGHATLARARSTCCDLLLLDQHLPGLDGDAILLALRADATAASRAAPAIATTAEPDSAREQLLSAGFAEVLPKPLTVDRLRDALQRHGCRAAALDDSGALRVCGSPTVVEHLRRLLAEQELPEVQRELDAHGDDRQALRPTLHRLRAACGFCGATVLGDASEALHAALASGADACRVDAALAAFAHALTQTRSALHAKLDRAA